ncbi:GtrA family protein [Pantoea sp. CFSAN033090]|uniref:GtrA family protein n=1 Tax=Pantoea sp. CFSAN033090 TaxID=1690502 RepID=UPI00068C81AF|nr:GtrA family protein [Pantoea sp. CFSAN033090]KOA72544.1 hypothetical protein AFL22_01970 [Pantoea sp. CFSAN033090]
MSFFLFVFVGVIGFVVDSSLLYILKNEFGLYISRGISFFFAVITTWGLNKLITFKNMHSGLPVWHEFLHYLKLMLIGGCVNYCAYAAAISLSVIIQGYPVIAVALGSLAGLFVNYLTSKYFLFKNAKIID